MFEDNVINATIVENEILMNYDVVTLKDIEVGIQKKSKIKISRPCPYCKDNKLHSVLTRHLKLVHRNKPEVVKAVSLPKREQREAFDFLRKKSIFQVNINEVKKINPTFIRERKGSDKTGISDLVICVKCKGCYSKNYKARHQIICGRESGQVMIFVLPVDSLLIIDCLDDDFKSVINKMIQDEVSNIAKMDPVILMIGARIYNGQKCKTEKKYEVEKCVRRSTRNLARLFTAFKKEFDSANDASEMFKKENLGYLRLAIDELTKDANGIKCGLKVQLQNLIKPSSKILQANYLVNGNNNSADIVRDFLSVFSLVEQKIFGGALY
ncbi:uncharacterized protein LOC136086818 [Hydra vulgaris]|uniref:Uncharacterized protein LOC136086818 n=1 Tax=Hydra vulgaris TaxID=6087 RepID=A0ABM4CTY2_HYDVU